MQRRQRRRRLSCIIKVAGDAPSPTCAHSKPVAHTTRTRTYDIYIAERMFAINPFTLCSVGDLHTPGRPLQRTCTRHTQRAPTKLPAKLCTPPSHTRFPFPVDIMTSFAIRILQRRIAASHCFASGRSTEQSRALRSSQRRDQPARTSPCSPSTPRPPTNSALPAKRQRNETPAAQRENRR